MKKICFFVVCFLIIVPVLSAKEYELNVSKEDTIKKEEKTTKDSKNIEENNVPDLLTDVKSAILIEATTGKILYEKNSHERYAPASMTKIMSMLLIIENIEKGKIKWNDTLVTSEHAASMGGSQIFLQPNEKMSVKDLFKAVAIGSANDATVVFAERIAGTEDKFVKMMNERAKSLGLKDTNFKNAVGLDTANHYSSAYDMAFIAKELVKHEKIFEFTTIYEDYLRQNTDNKFWLVNTNKLIKTYEGADGLKTGYTKEAGYCLTATAKKDNMRLISTVMGSSDSKIRNSNTTKLLDYGYNSYEMQVEVEKGKTVSIKKMTKAKNENIKIVPINDASVLVERGNEKEALNYEIKLDKLKLPIKRGQKVGILKLKDGDKVISKVDLTVKKDVKKASIMELYKRTIKSIFAGNI